MIERTSRLRRAVEPFLGTGPAHDLVALAEPKPGALHPVSTPQLREACLDLLELLGERRVTALGEEMPEPVRRSLSSSISMWIRSIVLMSVSTPICDYAFPSFPLPAPPEEVNTKDHGAYPEGDVRNDFECRRHS